MQFVITSNPPCSHYHCHCYFILSLSINQPLFWSFLVSHSADSLSARFPVQHLHSSRVATSWKSLGFFWCSEKSLNFGYTVSPEKCLESFPVIYPDKMWIFLTELGLATVWVRTPESELFYLCLVNTKPLGLYLHLQFLVRCKVAVPPVRARIAIFDCVKV